MFSVIVPLYNKVGYVKKTIQSIINQTFADFEAIIVDDGSTDGSAELVGDLISGHTNFKMIRQLNSGVGAARNHGAAESNGDYLCFLDADDWWESSFLEEMSKFIKGYPGAGIYATSYIYVKKGKTRIGLTHSTGYMNYPKTYFETGAMPITSITACIPRKVFCNVGGFPENIKLGEDFLLWSKIAFEHKVAFLNKPLAYYNNDIPASLRATRNLHEPRHHMLFNLNWFDEHLSMQDENEDWKLLLDKLRVNGLLEYWLNNTAHQIALEELKKVDWNRQPKSIILKYRMPVYVIRAYTQLMKVGAYIKEQIF